MTSANAASVAASTPAVRPQDLPGLTGLRGVAAVVVMLSHFGIAHVAPLFRVFLWQNAAVDLFFVLSCFTLLHVYDAPTVAISWRRFAVHRVARIYPLYLVLFAIFTFHHARFYVDHWPQYWRDAVRQALLVNCWPLIGNDIIWIVPSWSLSVEWLAYFALFPPLFLLHRRIGPRLRTYPAVAAGLALLFSGLAYLVYSHLFLWLDLAIRWTRIPAWRQMAPALRGVLSFLSGACLFICDRGLRGCPAERWLVVLAPALLVGVVGVLVLGAAWVLPIDLMIVVSPLLVLCAARTDNVVGRLLAHRSLVVLGGLSYSLYLIHYPVMILGQEALGLIVADPDAWFLAHPCIVVPVLTAIAVLLAVASHRWLEVPMGRWIRRFDSPRPGEQDDGSAVVLAVLGAAVAACLLGGHTQALAGDETRYLMYARGLIEHGRFVMSRPEWQALFLSSTGAPTTEMPTGGGGLVLMHGVYLPALLSPVALLGLAGLRDFTLLVGLVGMGCVFGLCRRTGEGVAAPVGRVDGAALLATTIAVGTIPLLPYLHLFYMETFLFALVSAGWWRLSAAAGRGRTGDIVTVMLILAIPFVHLRGAVVAVVLYGMLLWRLERAGRRRRAVLLAVLAGVALTALVGGDLAIYGAVTGPVNSARPPAPWRWLPVLSMQLFNVRHGLLTYAPVWILGYAGLAVGAIRGVPLAREGAVLAAVAAVTGVGVNPGECPPARFWVLSVPMLAVGFCLWWRYERGVLLRGITLVLLGFTLLNTAQFLGAPNAMLENRQGGTTYGRWFDRFPQLDFGLPLPVETTDPLDARAAGILFAGALLFAGFATAAVVRRRSWAAGCAVLLLGAVDAAEVRLVPPGDYVVVRGPDRISVRLRRPLRAGVGYLQVGAPWTTPYQGPDGPDVRVTVVGSNGRAAGRTEVARLVMAFSCHGPVEAVAVRTDPGFDLAGAASARLRVFRSRSFLWRYWPGLREDC